MQRQGTEVSWRRISRITYLLSSGKAIKIAYNKDVSQNSADAAAFDFFGPEYVPKIYDRDPEYRWLIVELVHTFNNEMQFKRITGGLTDIILGYLQEYLQMNKFNTQFDIEDFISWGKNHQVRAFTALQDGITPKGIELIKKFTFLASKGVSDLDRYEHWGIGADQRIVCVDTGLGG